MKKIRPILYSPSMSLATREGRKIQTRRAVESALLKIQHGAIWTHKGRYGKPGDLLWVREEHYRFGHWREVPGVKTKTGKQKWAFIPDTKEVLFDAPSGFRKSKNTADPYTPAWHKRLARFMPRALSRTTLEITDIRVERLQDISEDDARKEGIHRLTATGRYVITPGGQYFGEVWPSAKIAFQALWEKINGSESWAENPWVWVICFKLAT